LETVKNGDAELRRLAILAIADIGPAAAAAVPNLIALLRADPDIEMREKAAVALEKIGPSAAAAVPTLVEKLKDVDEARNIRIKCAMALQKIGPVEAAVKAVPTLLAILVDPKQDYGVRDRVMFALRVHYENYREMKGVKEALIQVMNEPLTERNFMLRYDCAYMLAMVWQAEAPDQVLDRLTDFLKDSQTQIVRGTRIDTKGGTGEGVKTGSGDVQEVKSGDGRIMAADALAAMGVPRYRARPEIMAQLRVLAADANPDVPLRKRAQELVKAAQ
jgi:HEAT repeat protein